MAKATRRPVIYVLAGTNGGGKSSIGGAAIRQHGADYFNPDEAARRIRDSNPEFTQTEANAAAWNEGRRLLEDAIDRRRDFAFETTLGGQTIATLLARAIERRHEVHMWFVGLASAELHIARVEARVARGGHAIPDAKIRERFDHARLNLIRLLPRLTELRLFDNSAEADPHAGRAPRPLLIVHTRLGRIVDMCDSAAVPAWAKPIVAVALRRRAAE